MTSMVFVSETLSHGVVVSKRSVEDVEQTKMMEHYIYPLLN